MNSHTSCTKSSFTKCCSVARPWLPGIGSSLLKKSIYWTQPSSISASRRFPGPPTGRRKGSLAIFDKGFTDYEWWQELTTKDIFFVTRLKDNALVEYFKKRPGRKAKDVVLDQQIRLNGMIGKVRLVQFIADDGNEYRFVTNAHHLPAETMADLYKERWKIELFFKWIKQNLKIKTFLGTSENAVLTQVWIALCISLLLAYLAFLSKIGALMQQILRLLQMNLFEQRDIESLFKPPKIEVSSQLVLL